MRIKGIRLEIVFFAAIITAGLLFGGKMLWYKKAVEEPLMSAHNKIAGIKSIQIKAENNLTRVIVFMEKVPKLEEPYNQLFGKLREIYNGKDFSIEIKDKRNPYLEDLLYKIHFNIEEAIVDGNFSKMADDIDSKLSSEAGVKHRIYVASNMIFVQIEKGENYLYQVYPREAEFITTSRSDGGEN